MPIKLRWIAIALLLLTGCCSDHERRIAVLEQRIAAETATVSWRQNGDTLWAWDRVLIYPTMASSSMVSGHVPDSLLPEER